MQPLNHQKRQENLQRHIQRVEKLLTQCEVISRRYSWARLISFLGGLTITWIVAAWLGSTTGLAVGFVALTTFVTIVILHQKLDRQETRFRIWRDIHKEMLGRLTLNWEHIPCPTITPLSEQVPQTDAAAISLDLDLTGHRSLHHLLDTAISHQGSQRLADWLTSASPDLKKITARQAVVIELARLPGFRKHLVSNFRQISQQPLDGKKLLAWLQIPYPSQRLRLLLPWASLLALINVALFVASALGRLPPLWIFSGALYGLLYASNIHTIGKFLGAVVRLDGELDSFKAILEYIETYPYNQNLNLAQQCSIFHRVDKLPSTILRRLKWSTAASGIRMNPVLGTLFNLLSPWDFWAAWLAARQRERMSVLLPAWLEALHELEALVSLGTFSAINPAYAFPKFLTENTKNEHPAISVRQMGHPLISPENKVCNDFEMKSLGEVAIITGSNMAGKSTFIRTIGVNLCLACAGGPVNAATWHSLPFRIYTCIRISDSLGDGFSYFYAEVKRLKGLLTTLNEKLKGVPLLYLIDEIFRGTNNRERLIGSRAFVQALINTDGIGLIATHDLELASLANANPQIHNFHFQDEVDGGKLIFDYRIHSGPSPTTNALRIMQMEGLPVIDHKDTSIT